MINEECFKCGKKHRSKKAEDKCIDQSNKMLSCYYCGYGWYPRGFNFPSKCPKCGKKDWDR